MDAYRVADTEADVPSLVDRAAAGEQVFITRDGQPVAELRQLSAPIHATDATDVFLAGLQHMPPSPVSSVELLRQMYEEDDLA